MLANLNNWMQNLSRRMNIGPDTNLNFAGVPMQKLIISLICCLLPVLTFADTLSVREDAPDRYVVLKGDTLWDISAKFFKDPWRWPKIWGLNKDTIKNPHWIYPGDVVVLDHATSTLKVVGETPAPEKQPDVEVAPTPAPAPEAEADAENEGEEKPVDEAAIHIGKGNRVSPRVRVVDGHHDAIPSIPYGDIKPFLNQTLVIEKSELDSAPLIVSGFERSLLSNGDLAYVKNLPKDKGLDWQIYRPGKPLIDPITKKTLGFEATYLGIARVEKFDDISTISIDGAVEEIYPGDRLVQSAGEYPENFIPRAPDTEMTARVMKIINGIKMAGQQAIVVINQGRRDGVQNGHVLALYRKGTIVNGTKFNSRDMEMPNHRYGLVFVFRTFENVSYGLVMEARMPVEMLDVAQTP
jgi:hypothetical protein